MRRKLAFTLIELLVVIAIIGILAAILFPVFNSAKRAAKIRADSSNMATLYAALKLYREDQGGYPPLLLQVAEYDSSTAAFRTVEQVRRGYLYRTRVKDINVFASVVGDEAKTKIVNAFWPNRDPRALGVNQFGQPETCAERQILGYELPGDQSGCSASASTGFSPPLPSTIGQGGLDPVTYWQIGVNPAVIPTLNNDAITDPVKFYAFDNYDLEPVKSPANPNQTIYELRYALFWTLAGQTGGGPNDSPRQLGYNDPKEDTVVTWNTYYRDYAQGSATPKRRKDTYVLFLNGSVRAQDSVDMWSRSFRFGQ